MFSTQCTPYSPHSCTAEATRTNVEQWLIRSHRCYCSYYYRHHPQHRFYSYDLQSDFSWSTAILLFSFWGSVSWVGKPADTHTQEKKQNPAKQFKSTHRCQLKNTHTLSSGRPVVHCSLRLHPWGQNCTVSLPCPRTSMGQPIRLLPTAKDMQPCLSPNWLSEEGWDWQCRSHIT